MVKHFNVKVWLLKYYNLEVNDMTFENTNNSLEFIWVWSIFEKKYLIDNINGNSYNDQLVELANKFKEEIKSIDINTIYSFLYRRYMNDHKKPTKFFKNLGSDSKWKKWRNTILGILNKDSPSEVDKLKLILLVIYKFRCNLFHGGKDPLLWKNFDQVFYQINVFLTNFLNKKWKPI